MPNKFIYAFIGPSGSGKTTIVQASFPKDRELLSFTTRARRPREIDKYDYYFIGPRTPELTVQLKTKLATGELIECIEYDNEFYGYAVSEIKRKFKNQSVAKVMTKEGYEHIMASDFAKYVVPVYVSTDKPTVAQYLRNRQDNEEIVQRRLALYDLESANEVWFDALPTDRKIKLFNNGDLNDTLSQFSQARKILETTTD